MEFDIKKIQLWLSSQLTKYMRVWRLLKKPSTEEFTTIAKVSAIGILAIGAIGFLISIIVKSFF
jgi:protein translocase SEC61 complex gamma subunit